MRCDDRVRVVASLCRRYMYIVHAFIIHQHHIHDAQRRAPRDVDSVFCCPRKDRLNENGHATNLLAHPTLFRHCFDGVPRSTLPSRAPARVDPFISRFVDCTVDSLPLTGADLLLRPLRPSVRLAVFPLSAFVLPPRAPRHPSILLASFLSARLRCQAQPGRARCGRR